MAATGEEFIEYLQRSAAGQYIKLIFDLLFSHYPMTEQQQILTLSPFYSALFYLSCFLCHLHFLFLSFLIWWLFLHLGCVQRPLHQNQSNLPISTCNMKLLLIIIHNSHHNLHGNKSTSKLYLSQVSDTS